MTSVNFTFTVLSQAARFQVSAWRSAGLVMLLALPVLVGCQKADPPKIAVFPVSGKVTLVGGEIPAGARLVFHAVNPSDPLQAGVAPTAIVAQDGTYKVGSYEKEDGAPAGEYKVTITWEKLIETPEEVYNGPNVLPVDYSKEATTPVTVTVQSGPTEVPPIAIEPAKK